MAMTIDGTSGLVFPAGGAGNTAGTVIGTTDTQTLTNKTITLAAGTASVAPFKFTSGTNLTTASVGAMEYDGIAPYFTPLSTQRGVLPAGQYFRLNTTVAGANATGAQSILNVGVTLSSSTVYAFEGFFILIKSAGATSHTISYGFGGTATVNNAAWGGITSLNASSIAPINTNVYAGFTQSLGATVYTTALATATIWTSIKVHGTVSVNAGGTLIPQYTLSAAPGGAYTTQIGSYFNIYPVGASGANTSVGTWA